MDLFDLPIEILEDILNDLSIKDLISCTFVCNAWRSGINQDHIWRQKCFQYGYDYELMETVKTHKFIDDFDPANEDILEQLCYWRQVFNWHCRLSSNWTNGNYVHYKLTETSSPVYSLDSDGERIVTGHENGSIALWSVAAVPYFLTTIKCLLFHFPVLSVRIKKNIIVAIQKQLIQIYYSKNNEVNDYVLSDAKSFEVGDSNIEQMERVMELGKDYDGWYKECLRLNEIYSNKTLIYNLNNDALFASTKAKDGLIWSWSLPGNELFTCHDLHEEHIRQIECLHGNVYVIVGVDVTCLLVLDTRTDNFNVLITVPGTKRFIIEKNMIIAIPSPGDTYFKRIWVWNKADNFKYPKTKEIVSIHHSATVALQKFVVYSEDGQVKVWDPELNMIVSSFTIGTSVGFIKSCFSTVLLVFVNSNIFLWNWKTGMKISCLNNSLNWVGDFRQLVSVNPAMLIASGWDKQLEMYTFL